MSLPPSPVPKRPIDVVSAQPGFFIALIFGAATLFLSVLLGYKIASDLIEYRGVPPGGNFLSVLAFLFSAFTTIVCTTVLVNTVRREGRARLLGALGTAFSSLPRLYRLIVLFLVLQVLGTIVIVLMH